jgi:hypothetical protein
VQAPSLSMVVTSAHQLLLYSWLVPSLRLYLEFCEINSSASSNLHFLLLALPFGPAAFSCTCFRNDPSIVISFIPFKYENVAGARKGRPLHAAARELHA